MQPVHVKPDPEEDSTLDPALRKEGGGGNGGGFMAQQYTGFLQQNQPPSTNNFAFDALFASDTSQMLDSAFDGSGDPSVGTQDDVMMPFADLEGCTLADVQKLPGYSESCMGDFLNSGTHEGWSVQDHNDPVLLQNGENLDMDMNMDLDMGVEPCYDEWLQE